MYPSDESDDVNKKYYWFLFFKFCSRLLYKKVLFGKNDPVQDEPKVDTSVFTPDTSFFIH